MLANAHHIDIYRIHLTNAHHIDIHPVYTPCGSIIASIDHINAPLMWDHAKLAKFNWIWQDCTTFAPYTVETSYETAMSSRASSLSVRGKTWMATSICRRISKLGPIAVDSHIAMSLLTKSVAHITTKSFQTCPFCKSEFMDLLCFAVKFPRSKSERCDLEKILTAQAMPGFATGMSYTTHTSGRTLLKQMGDGLC